VCSCECGGETVTTSNDLQSGNTKSCGCLALEQRNKYVEIGKEIKKRRDTGE